MVEEHAKTVKIPASEKKVVSYYSTTDGERFGYKRNAEDHQRLIDSLQIRDALDGYNGWFRVSSQAEVNALWLCASYGGWWDSEKEHYISVPAWVRVVSAYKDRDRYWHTEILSLSDEDLRRMLDAYKAESS